MNENIFEVLIYLFENYMDDNPDIGTDPEVIRTELLEAGFPQQDVSRAFEWMESLGDQQTINTTLASFRVFLGNEMEKLDVECRGFLLYLEQNGILSPASREMVVDRAMAFSENRITLDNLKWIVLMVLFSLPEEEAAFTKMEGFLYDHIPYYLH